jgi:hypothetical protein
MIARHGQLVWAAWFAVLFAGLVGCRSDANEVSSDGGFSPAAPKGSSALSTHVGKDECSKWADHATQVTVDAFDDAARACSQVVRDNVHNQFSGQSVSIKDAAFTLCMSHADQAFDANAAQCFMSATTADSIVACEFAPMKNPNDSDWPAMVADLRTKCVLPGHGLAPNGPSKPIGRPL